MSHLRINLHVTVHNNIQCMLARETRGSALVKCSPTKLKVQASFESPLECTKACWRGLKSRNGCFSLGLCLLGVQFKGPYINVCVKKVCCSVWKFRYHVGQGSCSHNQFLGIERFYKERNGKVGTTAFNATLSHIAEWYS